jgi:subtilisin family serine protease
VKLGRVVAVVAALSMVGTGVAISEVPAAATAADHPAAPAVASRILQEHGASPGSGPGGNHVAAVARTMGPRTDFLGVAKDEVEAYEEAIRRFLVARGAIEPPTAGTEVEVVVGPCTAALILEADSPSIAVTEGERIGYDLVLRNDPTGPCLGGAAGPTLAGHVAVTTTDAAEVEDVVLWLELPGDDDHVVLPSSLGLRSTPVPDAPQGCPDAVLAGCQRDAQERYGNTSFPEGDLPSLDPDARTTVPFVFFPVLDEDDVTALQEAGTLAVATTVDGVTTISREPLGFDAAPPVTDVAATATTPDGATVSAGTVAAIAPGAQVELVDVAGYVPTEDDPGVVVTSFEATAGELTASARVETVVTADASGLPLLRPAVWPEVVTAGVPTEVLLSVAPRGEVTGPVGYQAGGLSGELTDEGGVHTTALQLDATEDVEVVVSATVDGVPASGTVTVTVASDALPSQPAAAPADPITLDEPDGGQVLADRVVFRTDADVDDAQVLAAATAIGGTVVGRLSRTTWQVAIDPVTTWTELAALLDGLENQPGLVDVSPIGVGRLDAVVPDDPRFGDQHHLTQAAVDQAWAFNTGAQNRIMIAILDTGIDLEHEDLAANLLPGRDLADPGTPPEDTHGHGTHVAGIAAARSDNATGGAGVNWNASLLPVKVFPDGPRPQWTEDTLSAGIDFAVARGARVLNMSLSSRSRFELVAEALDRAWAANRVAVATSGNTGIRERRYPSGFGRTESFGTWWNPFSRTRTYTTDVLSVGNLDTDGSRLDSSTFGPWVDLAAPGTSVLSTDLGDTYSRKTGTSMAAPVVAGVASLMIAETPALSTAEVRRRLVATGSELDAEIGPALDAFQATFNGSFESGPSPWRTTGTVEVVRRLGTVTPRDGDRMLMLSTGPGSVSTQATVRRTVEVPAQALDDDVLRVSLRYNFLSSEYPNFVGTQFNDEFWVELDLPNGDTMRVVDESVNSTTWTLIPGIDFPSGDGTVGQSGWRTASFEVPADALAGETTFDLLVRDQGDAIYDSVALVDDIRVR